MNSAVRAPPICRKPVGEGAKRVTTSPVGALLSLLLSLAMII